MCLRSIHLATLVSAYPALRRAGLACRGHPENTLSVSHNQLHAYQCNTKWVDPGTRYVETKRFNSAVQKTVTAPDFHFTQIQRVRRSKEGSLLNTIGGISWTRMKIRRQIRFILVSENRGITLLAISHLNSVHSFSDLPCRSRREDPPKCPCAAARQKAIHRC